MIVYRTGNAAEPVERPAVIVHIVNDIGAWGAGFTRALDDAWPYARVSYLAWAAEQIRRGTGRLVSVAPHGHVMVAHLAAQAGLRGPSNPKPIDYGALDAALAGLASGVLPADVSVHMPRIGCGLAGGRWNRVGPMVERHLGAWPVYVYDLPKRNP